MYFFGVNAVSIELFKGSVYHKRYKYIDGNGRVPPSDLSDEQSLVNYTFTDQPPALNGATTLSLQGILGMVDVPKKDIKSGSFVVFVCQVATIHRAGDFKGELAVNWENFATSVASVIDETSAPSFLKNISTLSNSFSEDFQVEDFTSVDSDNIFVGALNTLDSEALSNYVYTTFAFPMEEGNTGNASAAISINISGGL